MWFMMSSISKLYFVSSFIKQTIITRNLHYKDGFDLNKGVEAKIHTLLPVQCTNGSEVQSAWSEAIYWISPQG